MVLLHWRLSALARRDFPGHGEALRTGLQGYCSAKLFQPTVRASINPRCWRPSENQRGRQRYLKEAPSYLNKTQILTSGSLPLEKSFFRRNLPGILIVSCVLLFALVVFVEQADKDDTETDLVYPTPEATATTTGADNSTSENDVETILIGGGRGFPGHGQEGEED
ncbi:uncharacterized protein [Dermacentor albipictus]|uniref:uncharacterized protein isoform X1 n=1 Tax=Dermacentor albipictus TaxID=60249 RepID=UPI0031FBBBA4